MENIFTSTLSSKGQLTLPKDLRNTLNLKKGQVVLLEAVHGGLMLRKAEIKAVDDNLSEGEWTLLQKLATKRGRRYQNGKKFLKSLK